MEKFGEEGMSDFVYVMRILFVENILNLFFGGGFVSK